MVGAVQISAGLVRLSGGPFRMGAADLLYAPMRLVTIDPVDLQIDDVTNGEFATYRAVAAALPFARFVSAPSGFVRISHFGPTAAALETCFDAEPVAVQPGQPVTFPAVEPSFIARVVPTEAEWTKATQDIPDLLGDRQPVPRATWFEAMGYAAAMVGGRLPTEAEIECAAHGGRDYEYGTDDGTIRVMESTLSGFNAHFGHSVTATVGSYPANPFGLYDIAGNIWK